jgi:hypothetical protein
LSEGVNLQSHFSAVIHYDLPWNPNRLEQREGRIDRYGQVAAQVKSCLLYGQDNPVDGAVLEVLIRKAVQIHKTLGITVPVPMDSTTVSEAVFKSLFDKSTDAQQLSLLDLLDEGESAVEQVHKQWDKAVEREKISRTRFAQKAIKPTEVEQELMESDQILGSEDDVFRFVKNACTRLSCSLIQQKQGWLLPSIPNFLQPTLGNEKRLITFTTPAPFGVEYVGRNHPLEELLNRLDELQTDLELFAKERSLSLSQSHQRVRAITQEGRVQVIPQLPMDLLGVYILQPGVIRNS